MIYPPFFAYVMKSERVETVTEFEGFVTLAYPVGVSLIEIELDEDELEELDEELEEEPNPLLDARVSTSHELESATNVPLVVTLRLRMTSRLEYSADFTELERVPIELSFEENWEAAVESSFQPMYCWSLVPIAADFAHALAHPLPLKVQSTTAPWL